MAKPTHDEKRFFLACVPAQGSRLVARHALCGLLMLSMSHFAVATEYFVDVSRPDDSGDGLSVATAKHTIQAAVDLARNDDIVTVLPGVYREGSGMAGTEAARVVITNRVWLRSRDGKGKTFIVGERADTATGQGAGELRCLHVPTSGDYSMIEGFTICGGATSGYGGGALCNNQNYVYFLDCVISNNVAKNGGGLYKCAAIRCRLSDNVATVNGAAIFQGRGYNSLICRNSGGNHLLNYCTVMVNCTISENTASGVCQNKDTKFYNSVVIGNNGVVGPAGVADDKAPKFYNSITAASQSQFSKTNDACVFTASRQQFFAPAFDDWRPRSGAECVGAGLYAYSSVTAAGDSIFRLYNVNSTWQSYILATYVNVDFAGHAIVSADGAVDCGCVQGAVTPKSGRVRFKGELLTDHYSAPGAGPSSFSDSYAYAETWPTQFCVRSFSDTGKPTFMFRVDPDLAGFACRFPEMDGCFRLTAPPIGTNLTVTAYTALYEHYVDKTHGLDTNGGTSTNDAFRTIQAAVNAASSSYYNYAVIHVAPGFYDEGGAVRNGISNRVDVYKKTLRIVAEEGPEKTFIVGAGDPDAADGMGVNAVRCVSWNNGGNLGCLQGFTLTGGRTAPNYVGEDYFRAYGGAFHDGAIDQVCDCIISNNVAYCGGANVGGRFIRCRIYGNTSTYRGALWLGTFVSCDIAGNAAMDSARPWATQGSEIFFSTLDGGCGNNAKLHGCVLDNRNVAKEGTYTTDGCVLWGTAPAGQTGCVVVPRPKFVSKTDHHPRPSSPAVGAADVSKPDVAYSYFTSDLDGNALYFANGNPTAGAYQVPDWTYNESRPFVIYIR